VAKDKNQYRGFVNMVMAVMVWGFKIRRGIIVSSENSFSAPE